MVCIRSWRALVSVALGSVALLIGLAAPVGAGGFEEVDPAVDLDESGMWCDFDGDGVYDTFADLLEGQSVLFRQNVNVDGKGTTHGVEIRRYSDLEHVADVTGESIFLNGVYVSVATVDEEAISILWVGSVAGNGMQPGVYRAHIDLVSGAATVYAIHEPGALCREVARGNDGVVEDWPPNRGR